ncbi:MAG TPA: hypothetical protein VFW57_03680, partial [Acidimicrobiia bacterium]|nr:hypothetical protein [Acidimicrobiia bacterium]
MTTRRWKPLTLIALMVLIGGAGVSAPSAMAAGDLDRDGIPDAVEIGLDAPNPIDADKDGKPDFDDPDSDNDAVPDAVEGVVDTDADGIPANRDIDTDGDRVPDTTEAGANPSAPADTDGDGVGDYRDFDSDGDGIPDAIEAPPIVRTWFDIDRDDDG